MDFEQLKMKIDRDMEELIVSLNLATSLKFKYGNISLIDVLSETINKQMLLRGDV